VLVWKYNCFSQLLQLLLEKKNVLNFYSSSPTTDFFDMHFEDTCILLIIQGVSEIRVLILTSERTLQFMKLSSITFLRKSFTNYNTIKYVPL
jgi:hypothetical protein